MGGDPKLSRIIVSIIVAISFILLALYVIIQRQIVSEKTEVDPRERLSWNFYLVAVVCLLVVAFYQSYIEIYFQGWSYVNE